MRARRIVALALVVTLLHPAVLRAYHNVRRARLENDVTVLAMEKPGTEAVSMTVVLKRGAASDPPDRSGLAELTARLLPAGTATSGGRDLAERIALLGSRLLYSVTFDYTTVRWTGLREDLPAAIAMISELIRRPSFPPEEVLRQKEWVAERLDLERETPEAMVLRHFFGSGPYGRPAVGDAPSVREISRKDLARFHRRAYRPERAVVAAAGGIAFGEFLSLAKGSFGDWTAESPAVGEESPVRANRAGTTLIVDRPQNRADVVVAFLGVPASSPSLAPLTVLSEIIAAGPQSRLGRKLRQEKTWVYDVWAKVEPFARTGLVSIGSRVAPELLEPSLQETFVVLDELSSARIPQPEIDRAKTRIVSRFYFDAEEIDEAAERLAAREAYGLGDRPPERFVDEVRSVSAEDLRRVAAEFLDPWRAAVAVRGDLQALERAAPSLMSGKTSSLFGPRPEPGR